jgi:hypothetical protein
MLTVGVGALALLAVVASACSSGNSTAVTTTTATGGSSASTTGGSSSTGASGAATIDPCSVVTDAVAAKVYGAGSTVTTSPSSDKRTCQVSIQGLSYELSVHVDPASDYGMQKSILFVNPTNFPGLGKEAVIGKSSNDTGAHLGLLYRTDGGTVYISDESDQAKLTALAGAIAAQG